MATQVQNRRGTTAEHATFTGAVGEVTVDTTKDTVVVHDGSTAGGAPLLREDQSNLPTSAPTTGLYNSSGALALSTNGTGRLFVDANGFVQVPRSIGNLYDYSYYGPVESVSITSGGSGYTDGVYDDAVFYTDGNLWGFRGSVTVSGGAITNIAVQRGGRSETHYVGAVLTLFSDLGPGAGFSATVASVRTARLGYYAEDNRIRFSLADTTTTGSQEIGAILFSTSDATNSYYAAGDSARIYGRCVGTSGGGKIDVWTAGNGEQPRSSHELGSSAAAAYMYLKTNADSNAAASLFIEGIQNNRNGGGIYFGRENALDWSASTANCDGFISFSPVRDNVNQEALRITSAGLVGIGTSAPDAKLEVVGTDLSASYQTLVSADSPTAAIVNQAANTYFRIAGGSYGNASSVNLDLASNQSKNKDIQGGWRISSITGTPASSATGSNLQIKPITYTSSNTITEGGASLTITNTGAVGIGTTSPDAELDVNGRIYLAEGNELAWHDGAGAQAARIYASATDELRFDIGSTASRALTIDSSRRLLVGTSSSTRGSTLEVNGSIEDLYTAKRALPALNTTDEWVIAIDFAGNNFDSISMTINAVFKSSAETTARCYVRPFFIGYASAPVLGSVILSANYAGAFKVNRLTARTAEIVIPHDGLYVYNTNYSRFRLDSSTVFSITSITTRAKT